MAIRDSQDVSLAVAQNTGKPRDSQDITLAVAKATGAPRDSQDVIIVLAQNVIRGTVADSQASQTLDAIAILPGCSTIQASQSLSASGSQTIHPRDSQDLTITLAQLSGNPRDSQDITLALAHLSGAPRDSQDVLIVLAQTVERGIVANSQASQSLDALGSVHGIITAQASQSLDALAAEIFSATETSAQAAQDLNAAGPAPPKSKSDKPSIQLHPVIKPLDFSSRPLTQAGKRSATFATLLTQGGASRAFSMPLGARNQPIAGKVFSFTMGGTLTPGSVGGTLVITPLYGANSDGVNLGQSAAQAYSGSTTPVPWRLKGEIIFQNVDLTPGASLVVCTGTFVMNGVSILFGSNNAVRVNASAITPSASGALNFAVSFAPSALNASAPVISTKYAFLR